MRKTILLKSRYGEVHRLKRIGGSDSHLFLFNPANDNFRIGYRGLDMKIIEFVDPSGGPYIYVGKRFDNLNKTVKSIFENEDKSIAIEFE